MIDMGGGSMQIAFEITQPLAPEVAHLGQSINLGCLVALPLFMAPAPSKKEFHWEDHDEEHTYRLYVSTFLGFGANAATHRYEAWLWEQANAFPRRIKSLPPSGSHSMGGNSGLFQKASSGHQYE